MSSMLTPAAGALSHQHVYIICGGGIMTTAGVMPRC